MKVVKPRILCVDDEPEILKLFEAFLFLNGYEVVKAENGKEGLEKIEEGFIDLVISDVTMPKMDGFELCRRVKENEQYRNIPVIIVTGLAAKEDRVKGIEAGAEDFISKPIDPKEVLARVKMLLKAKAVHEKQIGKLFIEMGFITEEQLQEALKVAKERNIKVGEALYSLGTLDKDHIYWVLSNQLNMNYVELSPEIVDKELVKKFSIDTLGQLLCLPLYETMGEIHYAIADPTDQKIVKEVKGFKPEKTIQLHLALPEKIMDILNLLRGEVLSQPQKIIQTEKKYVHPSAEVTESQEISKIEYFWDDLVGTLLSMSQGESCWFYKTPHECRLLSQKKGKFENINEYPEEIYFLIKERLKQNLPPQDFGREARLLLQKKTTQQRGAFKLWQINGLGREMIRIKRILVFSPEELMMSYPKATGLIKDLQHLFNEHHRLLIGGGDKLLIKRCCYSLLKADDFLADFPPPFFVEAEIEICFPKVAQLSKEQFDMVNLPEHFRDEDIPFLFYETEFSEIDSDEKSLSKLFSGHYKNIILYIPYPSLELMQKALSERQDWYQAGFKAIFLSQRQWVSI